MSLICLDLCLFIVYIAHLPGRLTFSAGIGNMSSSAKGPAQLPARLPAWAGH